MMSECLNRFNFNWDHARGLKWDSSRWRWKTSERSLKKNVKSVNFMAQNLKKNLTGFHVK